MRVVLSGCSGGGKSILLTELSRLGHSVVMEPATRVVEEATAGDGVALPWVDAQAFGRRLIAMSVADHDLARGLTFFDRGVVDAGVAITARGGNYPAEAIAACRYDRLFLAPPWPEIYEMNAVRRHTYETACRDYERVRRAHLVAGYDPIELPRDTVAARAAFVLSHL